jgi:hypothetical protein
MLFATWSYREYWEVGFLQYRRKDGMLSPFSFGHGVGDSGRVAVGTLESFLPSTLNRVDKPK